MADRVSPKAISPSPRPAAPKAASQIGSNQTTIGDVLTEINTLGIGVQAQINSAGNGILLYDTAGGTGTLKVTEGSSTTAADLHLLGTAATTTVNGQSTQAINGSTVDHDHAQFDRHAPGSGQRDQCRQRRRDRLGL